MAVALSKLAKWSYWPGFLVFFASSSAAGPLEDLRNCARIGDDSTRVACYEELGRRVLETDEPAQAAEVQTQALNSAPAVEAATAAENASAAAQPASAPALPDELGGRQFEERAGVEREPDKGLIVKCYQGPDKQWYFRFENGQVWKQVDGKRRRYKECNFLATIHKDVFGFKMQIEGEDGKIRVRRRK